MLLTTDQVSRASDPPPSPAGETPRSGERSYQKQFQDHYGTTSGNPKRERGTVNEAIPKISLAYALTRRVTKGF
jgi:hypothetical protein